MNYRGCNWQISNSLVATPVLLLFVVIGCSPTYVPQYSYTPPESTTRVVEQGKLLDLMLVAYSPPTLKTQNQPLSLYRTTTEINSGLTSTTTYDYSMRYSNDAEDENVKFEFSLTQPSISTDSSNEVGYPVVFGIKIINKRAEPIIINWDNVAYVDQTGLSHKVGKTGTRYVERDRPVGTIIIPPNARIEEIILPTDYVDYVSGKYGGWRSESVLEELSNNDRVTIFIPIEINEKVKNYSFTFEAKYSGKPKPTETKECDYGYSRMYMPEKDTLECIARDKMECEAGYKLLFERGYWECVKE